MAHTTFKASKYTHAVELQAGRGVLYNGRTGALIELSQGIFERTRVLFEGVRRGARIARREVEHDFLPHLIAGGFILDETFDELAAIEEQYQRERRESQFLVTILPTFGCNLGCEYCFVGKKTGFLSPDAQDRILCSVRDHLAKRQVPSMAVDWFGGEPLLALPVIRRISDEFQRLCAERGIPYHAQVITNGTVITEEAVEAMSHCGVDRLQVTLDGMQPVNDERRPAKSRKGSPFEQTLEGLERVVGKFLVRLRINVDRRNVDQVWPLLELFDQRGWIGEEQRFFPYLARISPFTDACAGVSADVLSVEAFEDLNLRWIEALDQRGVPVVFERLYGFPEPKLYNCGAVGTNGFVFNPAGEIHKCGLTVDDSSEAVGRIGSSLLDANNAAHKWQSFSPTANPVCRTCEFLPSCLGGCPRNQIENREVQKKENCTYYQQFENKILATHLKLATKRQPSALTGEPA